MRGLFVLSKQVRVTANTLGSEIQEKYRAFLCAYYKPNFKGT